MTLLACFGLTSRHHSTAGAYSASSCGGSGKGGITTAAASAVGGVKYGSTSITVPTQSDTTESTQDVHVRFLQRHLLRRPMPGAAVLVALLPLDVAAALQAGPSGGRCGGDWSGLHDTWGHCQGLGPSSHIARAMTIGVSPGFEVGGWLDGRLAATSSRPVWLCVWGGESVPASGGGG